MNEIQNELWTKLRGFSRNTLAMNSLLVSHYHQAGETVEGFLSKLSEIGEEARGEVIKLWQDLSELDSCSLHKVRSILIDEILPRDED